MCLDMRLQTAMFCYRYIGIFTSLLLATRVEGIVYEGCYKDSKDARVLPNMQSVSTSNSPEECARRCSDYRYAGVEYWNECYCGNTLNATAIQESECRKPCPGDNSMACGGSLAISIYTNWVCGPPPAIANGNATLRMGANITYGSIADVYCDTGFIGNATITCLSNISWEKATCQQSGTRTVSTVGTTSVVTAKSTTHEGSATAVYVGIGVAVGLVCAVGAVIVIIVLRRRGACAFKNGKNIDRNDTFSDGSLTSAIRSYDNTGDNHIYFVQSIEGTADHYNSADEPIEGNGDTDNYYSTEVTEQTYERMKDGNDEYDHTTNTLSSKSDSRERDNIYNKIKTDQHGYYDHFARPTQNLSRPGNDYDTTYLASMIDGIGDYNHIVSTISERVHGTKYLEQGGYDFVHGKNTKLPPCDDTDYANAKI